MPCTPRLLLATLPFLLAVPAFADTAKVVTDHARPGYATFDDDLLRASALADPLGFVLSLAPRMVLDEVQRRPDLFPVLRVLADPAFRFETEAADRNAAPADHVTTRYEEKKLGDKEYMPDLMHEQVVGFLKENQAKPFFLTSGSQFRPAPPPAPAPPAPPG